MAGLRGLNKGNSPRPAGQITVDHELSKASDGVLAQAASKGVQDVGNKVVGPSEAVLDRLSPMLAKIEGWQKYFHSRENRNIATVKSTRSRIFWICLMESALMVGMAVAQVYLIQAFFAQRAGGMVRV